jgi:RNA recognition motif-containing protein
MRIFVGNVAFSTSEFDLEGLFGRYGRVSRATIATDRATGRSRGFAFVEMPAQDEALAAIEALHGSSFGGRPLTVNEARPREDRDNPRPARW